MADPVLPRVTEAVGAGAELGPEEMVNSLCPSLRIVHSSPHHILMEAPKGIGAKGLEKQLAPLNVRVISRKYRAVPGLLVVLRKPATQAQFGNIKHTFTALVHGRLDGACSIRCLPHEGAISVSERGRAERKLAESKQLVRLRASQSVTMVEPLQWTRSVSSGWLTLVRVSHLGHLCKYQVRLHLHIIGHPIVGKTTGCFKLRRVKQSICMSCTGIRFRGIDSTSESIAAQIAPPQCFGTIMQREGESYEAHGPGPAARAYKAGFTVFHGIEINVTPDVLVPRSSSEALVSAAVSHLKETAVSDSTGTSDFRANILDLGVGSGCLLLACLNDASCETVFGHGVDLSKEALAVATQNARKLKLSHRSQFHLGSFAEVPLSLRNISFSVILCNPPYRNAYKAATKLNHESRQLEPAIAWCTAGDDELIHYREVLSSIRSGMIRLAPAGRLVLEVPPDLMEPVADLVCEAGLVRLSSLHDCHGMERGLIVGCG